MIKRTICFSNQAYLSTANKQLVVKRPEQETRTLPIEDLGFIMLDHPQITITSGAIEILTANNVAIVTCNSSHMPTGLHLALEGNTLHSERLKSQVSASLPLKKQLWQQTIKAKINNQASVLKRLRNTEIGCMTKWCLNVKSGDSENLEGRAAVYYWKNLVPDQPYFTRDRYGEFPNNLLNYGYAILRAVVARALVGAGLHPTLGIHHHNKYNAYCLADDIMEPYRPYVDELVISMCDNNEDIEKLCLLKPEIKRQLLSIPVLDTNFGRVKRPLMTGVAATVTSLCKCYSGESRKLVFPIMP